MIYIIDAKDATRIDFSKCLETSIETLQFSLDNNKTYITCDDLSALNGIEYLSSENDYTFTRDTEWWRASIYG